MPSGCEKGLYSTGEHEEAVARGQVHKCNQSCISRVGVVDSELHNRSQSCACGLGGSEIGGNGWSPYKHSEHFFDMSKQLIEQLLFTTNRGIT